METLEAKRTRVIVIEDHAVVRAGFVQIVETAGDLEIVGEAGSAAQGLSLVRERACDVVLLDISLPDAQVLDTVAAIRLARGDLAILIVSMHPEDQYALKLMRAGINGYFPKEQSRDELLRAIRTVALGHKYLSPTLAATLAMTAAGDAPVALHEQLGRRELQVFMRLAGGHSVTEIADDLNLSPKTISTYRSNILDKMGLSSNSDMTSYALRNGLLN